MSVLSFLRPMPWVLLLMLAASCLPKRQVLEKPRSRPQPVSQSGLEYIAKYKQIAIEEMHAHGIPASIKLAQGILESGNGNSRLAREANNHFGIKCASDWRGPRVYHDDDARNECFRSYRSPEESFRDHSMFLKRKRYEKLFQLDRTDYRAWAVGLKEAGYATNPRYADLLVGVIERYELYQYDKPGTTSLENPPPVDPPRVHADPPQTIQNETPPKRMAMRVHEVVAGETMAGIAARYGLTIEQLLAINGLRSNELHAGQLLLVSL